MAPEIVRGIPAASPALGTAIPVPSLGYRPELDGIRALAVLAVMGYHAGLPIAAGGFLGVDVFFVLSGFLITTLLIKEQSRTGRVDLRNFYVRRVLRLAPALLLVVAAYLALIGFAGPFFPNDGPMVAAAALMYVSNFVRAWSGDQDGMAMGLLSHTWSLSIEEQFYILWPVVLAFLIGRVRTRSLICLTLGSACLASLALRVALWDDCRGVMRVYNGLDTRADALLAGCLAGFVFMRGWLPKGRVAATCLNLTATVGAGGLLYMLTRAHHTSFPVMTLGLSLAAFVTAAIVLAVVQSPDFLACRLLRVPALVWIGRASYGLYLWHYLVFRAIGRRYPDMPCKVPAEFALAFAVAAASYLLFEARFLKLKSAFGPRAVAQEDCRELGRIDREPRGAEARRRSGDGSRPTAEAPLRPNAAETPS